MMDDPVGDDDGGLFEADGHDPKRYGVEGSGGGNHGPRSRWPLAFVVLSALVGTWLGDVVVNDRGRLEWSRPGVVAIVIVVAIVVMATASTGSSVMKSIVGPRDHSWVGWVVVGTMVLFAVRSTFEWTAVAPVEPRDGEMVGALVSDPVAGDGYARAIVEIGGRRIEVAAYGGTGRRLAGLEAGRRVVIAGSVSPPTDDRRRRLALRHVVGTMTAESVRLLESANWNSVAHLAAHRVREAVAEGSSSLGESRRALLLGLLLGADANQDRAVRDRFRDSGLAHLTAVSGQNVAFVLALLAPLLGRLGRWARLAVTLLALFWFVTATRFEPSVVRASTMSAVAAVAAAGWRRLDGREALGAAMVATQFADPFLLWSVGWWLSVSGCAGLLVLAPRLGVRSRVGRSVIAPALGAQVAVLPVSIVVFGVPNAWAIPCNLLVAPVAAVVMLIGLPACLFASFLPAAIARVVVTPVGLGVAWIDGVASVGAAARPPAVVNVATALLATVFVWRRLRRSRTRVAD